MASRGTASAISWNCTATAFCRPKLSAYATPMAAAGAGCIARAAQRVMTAAEAPNRTSWTIMGVSAEGNSAYTGVRTISSGWKWSPSKLNPSPLMSTTGPSPAA